MGVSPTIIVGRRHVGHRRNRRRPLGGQRDGARGDEAAIIEEGEDRPLDSVEVLRGDPEAGEERAEPRVVLVRLRACVGGES